MFISDQEKQARIKETESLFGSSLEQENSSLAEESSASPSNLTVISDHKFRGRTKGAKQIPDFLRPIIGASTQISGFAATQEAFGIKSTASPFSMARGKTTPDGPVNPELKSKVDAIVGKAQETAAEKLMAALGFITEEKLEKAKAGDLSKIAADMSRVIEKTSEKKESIGAQIVIYAPVLKTEEKFEVIESN